ncbi:uncharacterized protein LOC116620833 isoform X2 [Nematostella vectensis]|uniref:uncharacterized protein LOC116620833 isoform X2 n=1 Tax=Nematostella vectensis TaxID=45351 RepID=UPI0020777F2B|nr:uncharacterized protein LOC116620833 isoform X2 [Nematostella vectensis]
MSLIHLTAELMENAFKVPESHVITPFRDDVIESRLRLRYSATCDTYYRDWDDVINLSSKNVYPGWERGVFSFDSVNRIVDEKSEQVYFDRTPGSATGSISWKFDFSKCGLLVDEVTVKVCCDEGYGGEITTTLSGDATAKRITYLKGGEQESFNQLRDSSTVTLTIHFIGEQGQVTKLFPQRIMGGMGYPLDIQFRLKTPASSLGKPRLLIGLMFSNVQEIQVDSRHYKETGSTRGRGILHIHVHQARDLYSANGRKLETATKCFLVPGCKKGKCRTRNRKGKDPFWNEEFLIVGVDFLQLRRQALELCIVDKSNKKRFIGGLRLSLGYENVTSEQAKRAASVLKAFQFKTKTANQDNDKEKDKKSASPNGKPVLGVNGSAKGPVPEEGQFVARPALMRQAVASIDELRALDTQSLRFRCGSVDPGIPNGSLSQSTVTVHSHQRNNNRQTGKNSANLESSWAYLGTSSAQVGNISAQLRKSTQDIIEERRRDLQLMRETWFTSGLNSDINCPQSPISSPLGGSAEQISECDGAENNEGTADSAMSAVDDANNNQAQPATGEEQSRRSSSTCLGITQRWSARSQRRHSEDGAEDEAERELVKRMILDAVGLEINQWENVVNKPRRWHYCWQILRKDMIPVHQDTVYKKKS